MAAAKFLFRDGYAESSVSKLSTIPVHQGEWNIRSVYNFPSKQIRQDQWNETNV